jgi:hypothetical protein
MARKRVKTLVQLGLKREVLTLFTANMSRVRCFLRGERASASDEIDGRPAATASAVYASLGASCGLPTYILKEDSELPKVPGLPVAKITLLNR